MTETTRGVRRSLKKRAEQRKYINQVSEAVSPHVSQFDVLLALRLAVWWNVTPRSLVASDERGVVLCSVST